MISYVAQILNIFASFLQKAIELASFIGQLIVISVSWIITSTVNIFSGVILFLHIIYEDNILVFTEEVPNSASGAIDTIFYQFYYLWSTVSTLSCDTYSKLTETVSNVTQAIEAALLVAREVFVIFIKCLVFLGDTLWLILTFIPVYLPLLLKVILKFLFDTIVNKVVDAYMALLRLTNYLTEVPLQSFVGLTSTIIIVRLCVHFREHIQSQILLLYWSLVRNMLFLYYMVYNYFTNSEVRVISRMASGDEIRSREIDLSSDDIDDVNQTDALCVICQERQKCVLTLPCRHICLCTECCRRLYGYQRTCPICRTFIYHSVTVYL